MAWNQSGDVDLSLAVDADRKSEVRANLLAKTSNSLRANSEALRPASEPRRFSLRLVPLRAQAIAASIALLIGLSFVLAPDVNVIKAPLGSTQAVSFNLPDGTSGYLSAGSELRYSDTFGEKTRLVALKGEAVFDVTTNGSSFVVETYDSRVSVLGTSFAVRSWARDIDPETVVSVREGRVAVEKRYQGENRIDLIPNQQIRLTAETVLSPESILPNTETTFSWIAGGADFINMPIGNVLSELERRYDVILSAPNTIRDRRITLLPSQHATIDDVLIDMAAAVNIRYRKIAGGFEFYLN